MNTDKLMKMLSMETAASRLFGRMSATEQAAYRISHPRSRFASTAASSGFVEYENYDPSEEPSELQALKRLGVKVEHVTGTHAGGVRLHWDSKNAGGLLSFIKSTLGSDAEDVSGLAELTKYVKSV